MANSFFGWNVRVMVVEGLVDGVPVMTIHLAGKYIGTTVLSEGSWKYMGKDGAYRDLGGGSQYEAVKQVLILEGYSNPSNNL